MEQDFFNNLASGKINHAYLINTSDDNFIKKVIESLEIHPNELLTIEDNKIETIRQAKNQLFKKPLIGKWKAMIIRSTELLTAPAQNSLLKILEEPPIYVVIFLFTEKEDMVLPTIKSRCQKIDVRKVVEYDFSGLEELRNKTTLEKFKFAQDQAENGDLDKLLDLWIMYFHQKMLNGEKVVEQITKISEAKRRLGTNASKRLLLENILVEF